MDNWINIIIMDLWSKEQLLCLRRTAMLGNWPIASQIAWETRWPGRDYPESPRSPDSLSPPEPSRQGGSYLQCGMLRYRYLMACMGSWQVKITSMVVWMMDSSALARGRGDKCESRRTRLKRSMIRRTRKMEDNGASMQFLYLSSPIERTRNKKPSINDAELVMHVCLGMVKLSRWRRHIPYINISLQCTSFMQGSIQHFIGSFRPNKIYMGGDV